jgi:S-DNA-T family DNA segregation ATPase FtsK/SpoIIIE
MFTQIDPEIAENILGKLGAWLGYVFVYRGFGISSFAFSIIFLSLGIYLVAKHQPIPIIKTLRYSFFGVVWVSLTMGFLLGDVNPVLGGSFGYFGYSYDDGFKRIDSDTFVEDGRLENFWFDS